ncbi:MAG: hypothetical protein AB7Q17_03650 [Phycisphaerae bacterium]
MPERAPLMVGWGRSRGVRYGHAATLWLVVMLPLAWWGLPSRANDDLLFGGGAAWPAERFDAARDALRAIEQRRGGADTDLDPLTRRDELLNLTPDDDARAAILLRFRLYTRQPDEMITIRALARMKPRELDFDPRLYQYAGGYIYLFGASVGVAALAGLVHLTRDLGVYLEQPEQIARVYLVGRFLSLAFGALVLVAVARLAERWAGRAAGWLALVFAALSPVFVCGALEAKPHLPSVCLTLWATVAALRLVPACGTRVADTAGGGAVRLGMLGGGAAALVLTGAAAALLWPALVLARRGSRGESCGAAADPSGGSAETVRGAPESGRVTYARGQRPAVRSRALVVAGAVGVATFCALNPYLLYNVMFNRESLASNLSNSTAMYRIGGVGAGAATVLDLLVESVGWGALLVGAAAGAACASRRWREMCVVTSPAMGMVVLCVLIGAGKPGEFARFLLLPALILCAGAAVGVTWLAQRRWWMGLAATALVVFSMSTSRYVRAFAADARGASESRRQAAEYLRAEMKPGDSVALLDEPAPYATPPLDITRTPLVLLPRESSPGAGAVALPCWLVYVADSRGASRAGWWDGYYERVVVFPTAHRGVRIAWADKAVHVLRKRDE